MAQKKEDSRKINALFTHEGISSIKKTPFQSGLLSPNDFLKKYFGSRSIALKVRTYLLIVFVVQAFILLAILGFVSLILKSKESEAKMRNASYVYWKEVYKEFSDKPDVLFNLAKSSYENGKTNEAVEYLNKAIEIDPFFVEANKFLEEIN